MKTTQSHIRIAYAVVFAGTLLTASAHLSAQEAVKIPMTPERWETKDNVVFSQDDSYPLGVMKVTKGFAVLKDLNFHNGTIEFDVIPNGRMGAGIGFRRRDDDTYEEFYLRPSPKCEEAVDCMQYAPQTHGVLLWDMFPQYQGPAPLKQEGANHIKLVVNGQRMNIFVNGATKPTLEIGRLEGDASEGGILMDGPGTFTNLIVIPDAVEGLAPEPVGDPAEGDKRFLRDWSVSSFSPLPDGKEPAYSEMSDTSQTWQGISTERGGMINLSRQLGLPTGRKVRALVWMKTNINSNSAQTKHVSIGWSREIWIYVNGKQVYADKNLYQPPTARKAPDGRLSLQNGAFDLPLKKGKNEVAVALANNFYGWGLELHLDDIKGVKLAAAKGNMTAQK